MKLRSILGPVALSIGLAIFLCSCDGLASKITQKVLSVSMDFDYEDSEKWGKVIERDLDLPEFKDIDASGAVKVVFRQDSVCSVRVLCNEKSLDEYEIEVRRKELNVNLKGDGVKVSKQTPALTLFVTAPSLESLEFSGGCELELLGKVDMPVDLELETNGAAHVRVDSLHVCNFDVKLNGAGDFSAREIKADESVELEVNGAGAADVCVYCQDLCVELNGAATAKLSGECKHLKCDENGASNVDFSKLKR